MTENLPVLIAGAGPTGLAAALELTRLGIPVTIVEQALHRSPFSRALAFNPRSQQLLEACGVTGLVRQKAREVTGFRIHGRNRLLLDVDLRVVPEPPNTMLILPQTQTESLMEARLADMGIDVQRGWELTDAQDSGDRVNVRLQGQNGESRQLEASWLLGADGAHSKTRETMGIPFPGSALQHDWTLADICVDEQAWADDSFSRANLFREQQRFVFVLPVSPGVVRVVSDDTGVTDNLPDMVRNAGAGEISWQSSFRIHHRLVPAFRRGRCCLAGDAAHIHSPVGGRGMNMGIEDACLFARLMAENRLDEYHRLRHARARRAIRMIRAQTRFATRHDRLTNLVASTVLPALFSLPPVRRAFAARNMGLK